MGAWAGVVGKSVSARPGERPASVQNFFEKALDKPGSCGSLVVSGNGPHWPARTQGDATMATIIILTGIAGIVWLAERFSGEADRARGEELARSCGV
jgi:hypothetical protein